MIQKGLAFQRERSGSVTVPGANSSSGILPRWPPGHCEPSQSKGCPTISVASPTLFSSLDPGGPIQQWYFQPVDLYKAAASDALQVAVQPGR
jgi:hypothetical protein